MAHLTGWKQRRNGEIYRKERVKIEKSKGGKTVFKLKRNEEEPSQMKWWLSNVGLQKMEKAKYKQTRAKTPKGDENGQISK